MSKLGGLQKEIIKNSAPVMVFLAAFFGLIWLIPVKNVLITGNILVILLLISLLYNDMKKGKAPSASYYVKTVLKTLIIVSIFYGFIKLLGPYGVLGLIILVLLLAAYRLYRGRDLYMKGVRGIEEELFGKSLDKKYWADDNPRMKKVRWR